MTLIEAATPTTNTSQALGGSTDYSTAVHIYRIYITPAGVVYANVDEVGTGVTATQTTPFRSGLLGLYKVTGSSTPLIVRDLARIWRQ